MILDSSQHLFNRLDNHIQQLQGKIAILMGSLLTTLSVLTTIFIYSSENGKLLSIDYFFGGLSFALLILAFFIAYNIFFPKESYHELTLIEDFEDIRELSEEDLYSDILYEITMGHFTLYCSRNVFNNLIDYPFGDNIEEEKEEPLIIAPKRKSGIKSIEKAEEKENNGGE